uniref:Uncharacterized protein n=1 Tax=Siphoviridae sp. ctTDf8 TaxID=2825517 RepID=A0A8S5UJ19_9CAUD|nr:MAG TPA: hypothetical protein [Siphoviridae sp. ctTDf8]
MTAWSFRNCALLVALAFDYYLNILYTSMSENARVISGSLEVQILRSEMTLLEQAC